MKRTAALTIVALAALLGLTGLSTATAAPKPTTTLPAVSGPLVASHTRQIEQLTAQITALRGMVVALSATRAPVEVDTSDLEDRLATLESQVGVNSIYRSSITNLWSSVNDLKRQLGGGLLGGTSLDSRISSVERCLSSIRTGWSSSYAPFC